MKREKIVSAALTDEEFEKFKEAWLDEETSTGTRLSVSQFLRQLILTSINGQNPIHSPDTEQKNVSNESKDTRLPDDWGFKID